jgi:thymidylate synthase
MRIIARNSNQAMRKLLKKLKNAPMVKPRDILTKELINVNITIKNVGRDSGMITKYLPVNKNYVAKEIALYQTKSKSLKDYAKISNFWKKVSDNGTTIRSAYGYIIYEKHFDQFKYCLEILKNDINSRKAVITYKTPYHPKTKDNICTLSQQFLVRNNRLHTIITMRSNDIKWGFRNDLPWFVFLSKKIAQELGVKLGQYYHNVGSLHIYEKTMKQLGWLEDDHSKKR